MTSEVLYQLKDNTISTKEAYKELYVPKKEPMMRRAHFVKLRIRVPEEKGVNRFLRLLFLLPIPLMFVRIALRFVRDKDEDSLPLTKQEIFNLISYKGIVVSVKSKNGEDIFIKTL